ncbi:MAG: serine/threonine protein kinase [Ktedonobacteraceae bacterium]|nr:serine/threonine protein kinase [Ktedonobacteraceae bacterium]
MALNAEALIGAVLGTCKLQQLIGHGGMGAVYLAQQSRPRRQVAVKVLLPATQLTPTQQAAFLERFRRETDAAASLEHANILPVHEYGEREGLAYLVMPYIPGGTLHDEVEREKPMALPKVLNYLEQVAAALDFAHQHGVIHRDVKPANILMTADKRLLLTDFGLVKIISEGQPPQTDLSIAGLLVGTPEYMAPEQVLGAAVDVRADIYSLGVLLYYMVTGTVPFKALVPMQVAMQHLHISPRPPQVLRPDLPIQAAEVILRALAKSRDDRYRHVQELAHAFRAALVDAGWQLPTMTNNPSPPTHSAEEQPLPKPASSQAGVPSPLPYELRNDIVAQTSIPLPSLTGLLAPVSTPLPSLQPAMPTEQPVVPTDNTPLPPTHLPFGRKTNLLRSYADSDSSSDLSYEGVQASFPSTPAWPLISSSPSSSSGLLSQPTLSPREEDQPNPPSPPPSAVPTPSEGQTHNEMRGNLLKLAHPVKVVQVPIAGQRGRYVTGFLPLHSTTEQATDADAMPELDLLETAKHLLETAKGTAKHLFNYHREVTILAAVALLVLLGLFLIIAGRIHHTTQPVVTATPNTTATANTTIAANTLLVDPLRENIHNWPVSTTGSSLYVFKDGAYHITDQDEHDSATVILPDQMLPTSCVYGLTLNEIKGDDTSANNQFGMIFRFTSQHNNGKTTTTFYIFEVSSSPAGEYQFLKYDDSSGSNPWKKLWSRPFKSEFHSGHGSGKQNDFEVLMQGGNYVFMVNGKQVGTAHDTSLSGGQIGMLVNMKGTEVAFSNLSLTYK